MVTKNDQDGILSEIQEAIGIVKRYADTFQRTKYTDKYVACHILEMKFVRLLDMGQYSDSDFKLYLMAKMNDISPEEIANTIQSFGVITAEQVIADKTRLKDICISIIDACN